MKCRYLFLLIIPLLLNCPKKYAPKVEKIEAVYLSSFYEDIQREKPFLSGIKNLSGIKIGHINTDPPFMAILLGRLGFYELLNSTGIDFVIGDPIVFQADNINYFFVPVSMGYAIKNYEGIRFAILCKNKDSLTIADEITITLVKQRSDVLWVIDKAMIDSPPMKIDFFIKDRGLSDTSMTAIEIEPDTMLLKKLQNFKNNFNNMLSRKIYLENKRLDEYVLSKIALSKDVNVILYPEYLFGDVIKKDSISLSEILNNVMCGLKFQKSVDMTKNEILEFNKEKKYKVWGKSIKTNQVLLPDNQGEYLFDLIAPIKEPGNY